MSLKDGMPRSYALLLMAVLVLALIPRLGFALWNSARPLKGDAIHYDAIGANLAEGRGFSLPYGEGAKPTLARVPGYPMIVAGVYALVGRHPLAVYLVQVVVDLLTCLLVVRTALRWTRSPYAALLAGTAYALHPLFWVFAGLLNSETWSVALFLLTVLAFLAGMEREDYHMYALSGALLGLAALVRPTFMAVPFAFFIILLIARRARVGRSVAIMALFCVGFVLTLSPWILRNWRVYHRFIPTAPSAGLAFYYGTGPNNGETISTMGPLPKSHPVRVRYGQISESERDRFLFKEGIKVIRADPGNYVLLLLKKAVRLWLNLLWHEPPSKASLVIAMTNLGILFFAVTGMRKWRFPRHVGVAVGVLFVYWTLMHMASFAMARYCIQVLVLILPLSAAGFWWWIERIRGRKQPG